MLRTLLESQTCVPVVAIVLHHEVVVLGIWVDLGLGWGVNNWGSLHIRDETWKVWQTSSIIDRSILVGTTVVAIILISGSIVKDELGVVIGVSGAVWVLIEVVISEPHI